MTNVPSCAMPRLKVVIVTLGLFILIMTLLYATFMRIHGTRSNLEAFTQLEIKKANYLNQAIYITGYGGFIHNFKNAVLRHNPDYLINAEIQVKQSLEALDRYLALSPEHVNQVLDIQTVINNYRNKLPILRAMIAQGASISEIDQQVKVDDTLAVNAIKEILNSHQQHPLAMLKQMGEDYDAITKQLLLIVNILFIVSILAIAYMLFGYKKLRIAYIEKEIIFSCAPSAIITANENGVITQANPSAMELFHFDKSALGSLRIDDLVPDDIRQKHIQLRNEFQRSERVKPMADRSRSFTAKKISGDIFPANIAIATYHADNSKHSIVVIDDLSEREKIKQQACTDALTGIANRHAINQHLKQILNKIQREQHPNNAHHDNQMAFAIAMIDIDFFKDINDEHGHQTGDLVLQQLAHLIQQNIRAVDFVGRWGGEEFILVLEQVNLATACKLIDKMIKIVKYSSQRPPFPAAITISAGVTEYEYDKDIKTLIAEADQALYQAKNAGRDQVAAFSFQPLSQQQMR
ncbi:diguanylate cyclase [Motilimonas sp. KMU-193]|uniref:sensor domain-containing diguanylate cyclase n=1 Tax=Motilimonas sp. KMU-193 TaxID=3388668 RepID=UPI00396AF4EA